MDKLPISVIVITYNEEKNIKDCLGSVSGLANEVFVVDSGSTDKTPEIAAGIGALVYQHPFENFARQRNWSQDNLPLSNDWVFHIDADERVSPELAKEMRRVLSNGHDCDGFMAARRTVFRQKWIRHGGHYPVYHTRLFLKNKGRSEERIYDQNYMVAGRLERIEGDIINIINPDIKSWKARHLRWARLEAEEVLFNSARTLNLKRDGNPIEKRNWARYNVYYKMPLFIRCFIYFLYRYIIKLGFLDGKEGAVFHYLHGLWYRLRVDYEIYKLQYSVKRKTTA